MMLNYGYITPSFTSYECFKAFSESNHILIGGTTGSGKSILINGVIYEIISRFPPNQAKLILIDPKMVELSKYKKLPHTIIYSNSEKALETLQAASAIIEARYKQMDKKQVTDYSRLKPIPAHIYLIIDELADLMISEQAKQIKKELQHILQIGRASGISVIAATQAPNRKIIPAELVINFTDRIALRCASSIESKQIINQSGAELLPKFGKAFYKSPNYNNNLPFTVSIPMISEQEVNRILKHWKKNKKPKIHIKP